MILPGAYSLGATWLHENVLKNANRLGLLYKKCSVGFEHFDYSADLIFCDKHKAPIDTCVNANSQIYQCLIFDNNGDPAIAFFQDKCYCLDKPDDEFDYGNLVHYPEATHWAGFWQKPVGERNIYEYAVYRIASYVLKLSVELDRVIGNEAAERELRGKILNAKLVAVAVYLDYLGKG